MVSSDKKIYKKKEWKCNNITDQNKRKAAGPDENSLGCRTVSSSARQESLTKDKNVWLQKEINKIRAWSANQNTSDKHGVRETSIFTKNFHRFAAACPGPITFYEELECRGESEQLKTETKTFTQMFTRNYKTRHKIGWEKWWWKTSDRGLLNPRCATMSVLRLLRAHRITRYLSQPITCLHV